tara:strand:- start:386 stop:667 length:282 start_codon:yes stop_codon:yes gene_type:complete
MIKLAEQTLLDARDKLCYELYTTGDVIINGKKVDFFYVLEFADPDEIENSFSMLVRNNEDARQYAIKSFNKAFNNCFEDGEIEDHLVDEACEL